MKLHEILISTAFVTVVFMGFVLFYADAVSQYDVSGVDYSNASNINQSLTDLKAIGEDTKTAMTQINTGIAPLDILGVLAIGGYGAIKTVATSTNIVADVFKDSSSILPLGEFGNLLYIFAGTAVLIIIFIAILGHYIGQSDRI
jgi:hypothetical protein